MEAVKFKKRGCFPGCGDTEWDLPSDEEDEEDDDFKFFKKGGKWQNEARTITEKRREKQSEQFIPMETDH